MSDYYAHSSPSGREIPDGWQLLRDHLKQVAELARTLAETTGIKDLSDAAEAAGWLHDLGKYRIAFQEFIRGRIPQGSKQHKEAGAAWAAQKNNLPLAFGILGHHVGIPDPDPAKAAILSDDGIRVITEVKDLAVRECPELSTLPIAPNGCRNVETELITRLLLSCLVDADWADTSEHERQVRGWPEFPKPPELETGERLTKLLTFIDSRSASTRDEKIRKIRGQILKACLNAAQQSPGLFSLTVPTGGGKTLSGLAFALRHAEANKLRRIIYVAPYISIIDQNADVIREALGVSPTDPDMFEHQSLAEPQGPMLADEKQASAAARRAENWDSPIVITTNVQFFESLFSNQPGRCRKLHNIARSVIILDECQSLPPGLVMPTCQMLKQLTEVMGCSVVLCTATQPAFNHESLAEHRLDAREIIPPELKLFDRLKRVQLHWPKHDERLSWPKVAKRMAETPSALCVVNTKKAASDLFAELKKHSENIFHLSTSMCPKHRLEVLDRVKKRLNTKQPVFVVSTQLIEAGVDVDFPCVFREMGPLESIIQAAGRCNREGLMAEGGRVVIFRSEVGKTPKGWYVKGRDVVESRLIDDLNRGKEHPQVNNPDDINDYYERLYWSGNLDSENIVGSRAGLNFQTVADAYKLIDEATVPVVVASWETHKDEIERLLAELKARPTKKNFRALAPFQVNAFRSEIPRWPKGIAVSLSDEIDLLVWHGVYDSEIGRCLEFQNIDDAI